MGQGGVGAGLADRLGRADLALPLEAAFEELVAVAAASWPSLTLDLRALEAHVATLIATATAPDVALLALHADVALAEAALRNDTAALAELDGLVTRAAARAALRGATPDELAQRVREELLVPGPERPAKLSQYSGRGPLAAWLRVLVTRTALTMQRSESRRTKHHDDDDALARAPALGASPEMAVLRAAYAEPFRAAFREAIALLAPEDRTMLRLHLVDNLGIDRLAPMYGIHRATAARRLVRAKETVLEKTRELLAQRMGLSDSEFTSLVGVMLSGVEVSLSFLDTQR